MSHPARKMLPVFWARPAMSEFQHVCVRRPCLLCALDRGDPLPPGTRLIDTARRRILLWHARGSTPESARLVAKIEDLSPPLRVAVEQLIDELHEHST